MSKVRCIQSTKKSEIFKSSDLSHRIVCFSCYRARGQKWTDSFAPIIVCPVNLDNTQCSRVSMTIVAHPQLSKGIAAAAASQSAGNVEESNLHST